MKLCWHDWQETYYNSERHRVCLKCEKVQVRDYSKCIWSTKEKIENDFKRLRPRWAKAEKIIEKNGVPRLHHSSRPATDTSKQLRP